MGSTKDKPVQGARQEYIYIHIHTKYNNKQNTQQETKVITIMNYKTKSTKI